jgi:hypothetical protein
MGFDLSGTLPPARHSVPVALARSYSSSSHMAFNTPKNTAKPSPRTHVKYHMPISIGEPRPQ